MVLMVFMQSARNTINKICPSLGVMLKLKQKQLKQQLKQQHVQQLIQT